MTTMRRALIALVAVAAQAAVAPAVKADAALFLPDVRPGGAPAAPTASARPPAVASEVLPEVPVPAGARLVFHEMRPDGDPPEATADYDVAGAAAAGLGAWYRDQMATRDWHLVRVTAVEQRWQRDAAWLTIRLPAAGDDRRWLRLRRDLSGVVPAGGWSLHADAPVPEGAIRWRFDAMDLLVEEVRVPRPAAGVAEEMEALLARSGWRPDAGADLAAARLVRYAGPSGGLLVSVGAVGPDSSEVGLGTTDCLDDMTAAGSGASVFLDGLPAPPRSRLEGYARDGPSGAVEDWRGACMDLDLLEAGLAVSWRQLDWPAPREHRLRSAGRLESVVEPVSGPPFTLKARVLPGAAVSARFVRDPSGRRIPAGRALASADLPVPPGADALRFERDADGWAARETYELPDPPTDPAVWVREATLALGWSLERLTRTADGADVVFFGDGEEVLAETRAGGPSRLVLSRRRVCATGLPVPVPAEGGQARRLDEVPVFPGAVFSGGSAIEERYEVRCSSLDQMAAWYRAAMERGRWALAMTVGPEDRFARKLLFVRPEERSLPPELRTAWAEVSIERSWPYQYVLVLRRDEGGVRPLAVQP